jgi:hypothetical protein
VDLSVEVVDVVELAVVVVAVEKKRMNGFL